MLKEQKIVFANPSKYYPFGSQIICLIGANGSGKTVFCSLLAEVIQSFCVGRKVDCDYRLVFKTGAKKKIEVINVSGNVEILIDGKSCYAIDTNTRNSSARILELKEVIGAIWQGKLILSTFETRGEYRNPREPGYIGYDPLIKFDTKLLYEKNLIKHKDISRGMMRYLTDSTIRREFREALSFMGLHETQWIEVKISNRGVDFFNDTDDCARMNVDRSFIESGMKVATDSQYISVDFAKKIIKKCGWIVGKYLFLNNIVFEKHEMNCDLELISSGEKFMMLRLLSILSAVDDDSVIIIEEPECHLNPSWSEVFIAIAHSIATKFRSTLIFTTHSRQIVRGIHNEFVFRVFNGILNKVRTKTILCDEFDFEEINSGSPKFTQSKIDAWFEKANSNQKGKLIDSLALVPEKFHFESLIKQ